MQWNDTFQSTVLLLGVHAPFVAPEMYHREDISHQPGRVLTTIL